MNVITDNITSGLYRIVDVSKTKKSDVWNRFSQIYENDKPLDVVICKYCNQIYNYPRGAATNVMRKHKCAKPNDAGSSKIDKHFSKKTTDLSASKKKFAEACAKFVAKDLRPYNIVSGIGFQNIIQAAIEIGASKGNINTADIISHRTVVATKARKMANTVRLNLKIELEQYLTENYCAVTTDLWTDDYRKLTYLALTVHYIDKEWNLKERVLNTKHFDDQKTAVNILSIIEECLRDWNFSNLYNVVFVTDRGSNILAALRTYNRLNCAAHLLNNVLQSVFKDSNMQAKQLSNISVLLHDCRDLVGYFKRSGLMEKLPKALNQVVDTRWNTHLSMINSIYENFDKIINLLADTQESHRVDCIDKAILEKLIEFLMPFKEITDILEASSRPTLHCVVPCRRSLLQHLTPSATDAHFIGILKVACKQLVEEKFLLDKFHRVALFLNPKMRTLKALDSSDRYNTLNDVHALLVEMNFDMPQTAQLAEHAYTTSNSPLVKRRRIGLEAAWEDDDENIPFADISVDSEIEKYKSFVAPAEELNLLQWWKDNSTIFPRLTQLARRVLCIPASSAPSERNFSAAGLVVDKLRTRLNPKNVDDLLLLHSNFDLIK